MSNGSSLTVLYRHLCKVLGNQEMVRTKQLMSPVSDFVSCDPSRKIITIGSTGEGLNLPGSDLDAVNVLNYIPVFIQLTDVPLGQQSLVMDTVDTKP